MEFSSFIVFLDELGLETMFADHPVKKKAFLHEKNIYRFYTVDIFGLFHRVNLFVQKLEKFLSQFDFGQMSLEIMFDDHPSRKQAFLDYTNIDSKQWPY